MVDKPVIHGIDWAAGGDANFYALFHGGHWIAKIQFNGELPVSEQEALLAAMAAPAVQGEPVGWVWHSYNQTNFTSGSHHKEVLEADGVKLTPLYTAPQPAEQQPPDVSESKATTPKESWWAGYRAGKGLPANTPRQDAIAAPDVSELVEARELLLILRGVIGGATWTLDDEEKELAVRVEKAVTALAAYCKQGG